MKTLNSILLQDFTSAKKYIIRYEDPLLDFHSLIISYDSLTQAIKDKYNLIKGLADSLVTDNTQIVIWENEWFLVYKNDILYKNLYSALIQTDKDKIDDFVNHVKTVDLI